MAGSEGGGPPRDGKPPGVDPKSQDGASDGAEVFDFNTGRRLGPTEIETRKRSDTEDSLRAQRRRELLSAKAREQHILEDPRMMARAMTLLRTSDQAHVFELLDEQYQYTKRDAQYSELGAGMSRIRSSEADVLRAETHFFQRGGHASQLGIAEIVLRVVRTNNYVERIMGDRVPEELREREQWTQLVEGGAFKYPDRDIAKMAVALVKHLDVNLNTIHNYRPDDPRDRIMANPLLFRPDVLTLLRTLTKIRAVQQLLHVSHHDIDAFADVVDNQKTGPLAETTLHRIYEDYYPTRQPDEAQKKLRKLDAQTAVAATQEQAVQFMVHQYDADQLQHRRDRQEVIGEILRLRTELAELPAVIKPRRFFSSRADNAHYREHLEKVADLNQSIMESEQERRRIEEDIDPDWSV